MNPLDPSAPTGRPLRPLWGWVALLALTQLGMASRGCSGDNPDTGSGAGGGGTAGTGASPGNAGASGGSSTSGCDVSGTRYAIGERFASPDGCNTCTCTANGAACTERACAQSCGGLIGAACPTNQYCNFPTAARCGAADASGSCALKPETCNDGYQPVCGCDGKTYGNDCAAAAAGVSVAARGACGGSGSGGTGGGEPKTCGGLLGTGCAEAEFCKFAPEARCGTADASGECTAKPEICDDIYSPVCGCDGSNYGSACSAEAAGVSVEYTGVCDRPLGLGARCGVGLRTDAVPCAIGLFCQYQPGALCGAADAPGECVAVPTSCPSTGDPVCGCDGITYANACNAALAQAGILDTGRCN